jgi:hypothetical protein
VSITAFSFGEWLPDLPDLGNPGLTEALNVLPSSGGGYVPFLPLLPSSATLPSQATGGFRVIYAGGASGLIAGGLAGAYFSTDDGASWSTIVASASSYVSTTAPWQFGEMNGIIVGIRDTEYLRYTTAIAHATFVAVTSAPLAEELGIVNQFVVLGNLGSVPNGGEAAIQWGPIGDPAAAWPTPSSATAIATQSGRQFLDTNFGTVTGIHGNDQFGIILQEMAVTRMTYVGPPAVFQFDRISAGIGAAVTESTVKFEGLVYFLSRYGAYVTDGVTVQQIGEAKISRYLSTLFHSSGTVIRTGIDTQRNLIYWGIASTISAASLGYVDHMLVYHVREKKFTHAPQSLYCFIENSGQQGQAPSSAGLQAFGLASTLGYFNGSAGTATIITGEVEPQPGGCALINGIKPVIASSGTAPTIGVQVGSRDDQATSVSYSSTTTPTSRTGFADFRSDARFHRARVYIAGNFDKALGLEIDATPTGGM